MLQRQSPSGPVIKLPSYPIEFDNGPSGSADVVDWSQGPAQRGTLTANAIYTSSNLPAGQPTWLQLKLIQGAGGGFSASFAGAKTPGGTALALSSAAGAVDLVSLYWDGAVLFATVSALAFA